MSHSYGNGYLFALHEATLESYGSWLSINVFGVAGEGVPPKYTDLKDKKGVWAGFRPTKK
jgi:hypothetical protein